MKNLVLVIFAVAFMGACDRTRPILEVHDQAIPKMESPLTMSQVEANIVRAGVSLGWRMKTVKPGLVRGTIRWKRHSATVGIKYDTATFSILYESSYRLKEGMGLADTLYEGKRVIHNRYNKHVKKLRRQIETFLFTSGS